MSTALAVTPSYAGVCDLSEAIQVTWAWGIGENLVRMFMHRFQSHQLWCRMRNTLALLQLNLVKNE